MYTCRLLRYLLFTKGVKNDKTTNTELSTNISFLFVLLHFVVNSYGIVNFPYKECVTYEQMVLTKLNGNDCFPDNDCFSAE